MAGLTVDTVLQATAAEFRVPPIEIVSMRRNHNVTRARFAAVGLACEYTTRSLAEIGRRIGGRDHSTIHHARLRFLAMLEADAEFTEEVRRVRSRLDLSKMVYSLPDTEAGAVSELAKDLLTASRRVVAAHRARQTTVFGRDRDARANTAEQIASLDALGRVLDRVDRLASQKTEKGTHDEHAAAN